MKMLRKVKIIGLFISLSLVVTSNVYGGKWSRAAESLSDVFERSKRVNLENTTHQSRDAFKGQQRALEEQIARQRAADQAREEAKRAEALRQAEARQLEAKRLEEQRLAQVAAREKATQIAKQIEEAKAKVIINRAGDPVIMKGDKKVRLDVKNSHGDKPHFHNEVKDAEGNWVDAGSEHRYYFKKE